MDEIDVLRDVIGRLDRAGVAYMLTGSMAMNFYTEPRMTRDIDIVAELGASEAERIIKLFRPEYYVPDDTVREAVNDQTMFNLIHTESVMKVDFMVRKHDEYRRVEFERRVQERISDFPVFLVSKEDLIISKLVWARNSRSGVQKRDIQRLLASGYDQNHLERWLQKLDLADFAEEWLA